MDLEHIDHDSIHFLVVDDHMLIRKLVTQQLSRMGFNHVDTATNGSEAMVMLQESLKSDTPYDIVLLDWSMPVMDGMEVIQKCKDEGKYNDMAFVMLTGEREKDKVLEALEAGVASYIIKPISQSELEKKMASILSWLSKQKGGDSDVLYV